MFCQLPSSMQSAVPNKLLSEMGPIFCSVCVCASTHCVWESEQVGALGWQITAICKFIMDVCGITSFFRNRKCLLKYEIAGNSMKLWVLGLWQIPPFSTLSVSFRVASSIGHSPLKNRFWDHSVGWYVEGWGWGKTSWQLLAIWLTCP